MFLLVVALEDIVVDGENKFFPFLHGGWARENRNERVLDRFFETTFITIDFGFLGHFKVGADFVEFSGVLECGPGLTKPVKLHHCG